MTSNRFIKIDEEGYFHFGDERLTDEAEGYELLKNLRRDEKGKFTTQLHGTTAWVEAFDQPIVVRQVYKTAPGNWEILAPYGFRQTLNLSSLTLDQWDRFHGVTDQSIPFVFSRTAQAEFFNLLDEFDDTSVTADGVRFEIPAYLKETAELDKESFWTKIYREETPRWELDEPAKPLVEVLPQLKIPKSRILVLGCGSGNDAAHFAEKGHVVTAIDISPAAISQAKQKFGHLPNLEFVEADAFSLNKNYVHSYDLVFEHTFFCAINPQRRDELVKIWARALSPGGFLLGIFFVFDRPVGPPFGASEWEIRERLKSRFQFLYWTRWRTSIESRMGQELVVFAQKKPTLD